MRSFSAFLQARGRAGVPVMFSLSKWAIGFAPEQRGARDTESAEDRPYGAKTSRNCSKAQAGTERHAYGDTVLSRTPYRLAALLAPALLAACGFNGTDPDEDETAAAEKTAPAAVQDPDFADFAAQELADSEPRPEMQLQVVLDQQGFGPGVIDGGMGLSTRNALKGFQEANSLAVTGQLDEATKQALARWKDVPATRVVRIPESWGQLEFAAVPEEPEDQAKMDRLGYESMAEKLAERFHTTPEVLQELNPGGRPAGAAAGPADLAAGGQATAQGNAAATTRATTSASPSPSASATAAEPTFRAGQLVRVPNIGLDNGARAAGGEGKEQEWQRTLASLGVSGDQPKAARVVVDKSESWLKAYDEGGKLLAMYTVTSGSGHDPLPLGEWGITGVGHNPPFRYDPDLFWDVPDSEEEQHLPPGPNGPVGVVWIDLTKEHYGIHGTPEPQTIGRAQSHGCVRLSNWDAARLAGMVDTSTKVIFQA
jgi:lipoprotein-anchoring transpeptidase ErfK/SrfK